MNNRERIRQIGREIKKYKNMARTANRQQKWRLERRYLEKIQALNIERKELQQHPLVVVRAMETGLSPRIQKKIRVLMNEIARDSRILETHKANNNIPGIKKYENILRNERTRLAQLQGRQQAPATPVGNNNRRIRVLLNEIRRDRRILERHRQAGNQAGVQKYEQIVQSELAELKRLRGQGTAGGGGASAGSGNNDTSPGNTPTPPSPPAGAEQIPLAIKEIAIKFRQSNSGRRIDIAHNAIFRYLLQDPRFRHLPNRNGRPWPLYRIIGNTTPPPAGSLINQPFILDAMNISVSNIILQGYTVKDAIFDTPFVPEFDRLVKMINDFNGNPAERILPSFKHVAHRDAFQLIPQEPRISRSWSQYAGAMLKDVTLKDITIQSPGSLQGIFSSDGAYESLHFENISVDTQSRHGITILGYLSGTLDLRNSDGSQTEIELLPLRLGGGTNIYVIGFSGGSSYQYGNVVAGAQSNVTIKDNRQVKTKPGTYYSNFDMDNFIALIQTQPRNNFNQFIELIKLSAERSGDRI